MLIPSSERHDEGMMTTETTQTETLQYTLIDDSGSTHTIQSTPERVEYDACDWVEGGDYGGASTVWVDVRWECEDGTEGSFTVSLDPEEPKCDGEHQHEWVSDQHVVGGCDQNPGVQGHGGGVIIVTACAYCGCRKTEDTWAQRPDTGEQGLRSVSYESGAYELHEYAIVHEDGDTLHYFSDVRSHGKGLDARAEALMNEHGGSDWVRL